MKPAPAKAYLTPNLNRPNLKVITYAVSAKIELQNRRATGVQFYNANQLQTVRARREVVVSAGAFGLPQLLQLSGMVQRPSWRASMALRQGITCRVWVKTCKTTLTMYKAGVRPATPPPLAPCHAACSKPWPPCGSGAAAVRE